MKAARSDSSRHCLPTALAIGAIVVGCGPKAPRSEADVLRFAVVGDRTDEPDDVAWARILGEVQARAPDLVLTVGDLADDAYDPTDWDRALGAMAVLTSPIAHTPGNHDIVDEETARVFEARTGQAPHRSFDAGGVHFVVVDNAIAESWDALPEAQRAWLAADLAAHADGPVVVSMHKPFWALGVARGQPDPMHELFVAHGVDVVFTGHWHTHFHERIAGIEYVGVGTSGGVYAGLQDARRGNAYEYVWAEYRDGRFDLRTIVDGEARPIDEVTLADSQALRALRMGQISAISHGGDISLRLRNEGEAPIDTVLTIDPGEWTVPTRELAVSIAPGATFEATIPATPGPALFPSPRIALDWPLPDAGLTPYAAPVDVVREALVPRGHAVVDGILDEWEGAPDLGPLTTAEGLPAEAERTTAWLRRDDEALYFAAELAESDLGALQRLHTGRDRHVVYDDRIGLMLSPTPDELVWFYVNPNGAVWDLRRSGATVNFGWDEVEAVATVGDGGWRVEARIPFAAMGLTAVPETWAFDLRRRQERTQAEATFTAAFWSRDRARMGVLRLAP